MLCQEKTPAVATVGVKNYLSKLSPDRDWLATDSEWDGQTPGENRQNFPISTQVIFFDSVKQRVVKYLLLNTKILSDPAYDAILRDRVVQQCEATSVNLRYVNFSDDVDNLEIIYKELNICEERKRRCELLMFFSSIDIWQLIGHNKYAPLLMLKEIHKKRALVGKFESNGVLTNIRDLKGFTPSGLATLADTVNVELADKGKISVEEKKNMYKFFLNNPETFVKYSMGDVDCLFQIYVSYLELMNSIENDLGIPQSAWYDSLTLPMTTGAQVAGVIQKFFKHCVSERYDADLVEFAFRKLGHLDVESKTYKYARYIRNTVIDKVNSVGDFERYRNSETPFPGSDKPSREVISRFLSGSHYSYLAYSQGSVKWFASDTRTSQAFLAPVQGGRCNNERPNEYYLEYVMDADLKSAYGSVLRQIEYPIGLPKTTFYTPNQTRHTLKEWLSQYTGLASRLWMVIVEGELSFRQDLIYSKRTTQAAINRSVNSWDADDGDEHDKGDEISKIPGDFVLVRKQIINGVITEDILNALEKICTNTEWAEIMKLEVVCAEYYLEADRVASLDEWVEIVLNDKGRYESQNNGSRTIVDTRTCAWYGLPLDKIFGTTGEVRNRLKAECKKLKNEGDLTPEKRAKLDQLNARQNALKLFNNTGYGVLASPYFDCSNTLVANNITAIVRLNVWMMAKALNCNQCITDGSTFEAVRVFFLNPNTKKPGLSALSDVSELAKHRSIRVGKLGGIDWEDVFVEAANDPKHFWSYFEIRQTEQLVSEHVRAFWDVWGLKMDFGIELKPEHTSWSSSYFQKGDYHLRTLTIGIVHRIRGTKLHSPESGLPNSPKFVRGENAANGIDTYPVNYEYIHSYLMSITKYVQVQTSKGFESLKSIRSGEEVNETRKWKDTNDYIPVDTWDEYDKLQRNNSKGGFEEYGAATGSIKLTQQAKSQNNLKVKSTAVKKSRKKK